MAEQHQQQQQISTLAPLEAKESPNGNSSPCGAGGDSKPMNDAECEKEIQLTSAPEAVEQASAKGSPFAPIRDTEGDSRSSSKEEGEQEPNAEVKTASAETFTAGEKEEQLPNLPSPKLPEESKSSFNPSVEEQSEGDLELLRGDAIGSTLYSERFVLSTLLKLNNSDVDMSKDKEFDKQMCALWDMTIEEDVILLLLEHNILELFSVCINATSDMRLTEILVGIIGNMCHVKQTRQMLCANAEVTNTILCLISCSDTQTLIQLMRLITVVLTYKDDEASAEAWYRHFCEVAAPFLIEFTFILSNSINVELLQSALGTLNALLAKFACLESPSNFSNVFLRENIIQSTMEAFHTILQKTEQSTQMDDTILPSESVRKTIQLFVNINSILTQYQDKSHACYAPYLKEIINCLNIALEPLCEPNYLLPLGAYEYDLLDNVNDIFKALKDPFDECCLDRMLAIWYIIAMDNEERGGAAQEFEDDTPDRSNHVDPEAVCCVVLDFINRFTLIASEDQLKEVLVYQKPKLLSKLLKALQQSSTGLDTVNASDKLKNALEWL